MKDKILMDIATKTPQPIRVLLADDHSLFAAAVKAILDLDDRFEVVGVAGDGADAVAQAEEACPDVVVMDISMPVLDGFQATRELCRRSRGIPVLILSGSSARADVAKARKAGASGYITKDRIASELIDAILDVVSR